MGDTLKRPTTPSRNDKQSFGTRPRSPSKAPTGKVLAGGVGSGYGGAIAVILAYHFPHLPDTVTVAYTTLLIGGLSMLAGYLQPPDK